MRSMHTQQLTNGIRLRGSAATLAQFQTASALTPPPRPPRVAPVLELDPARLDPRKVEHYHFGLSNPVRTAGALEPWHAVVLHDRVTHRGTVHVYLTDGDWRCEVPSRIIEQVLGGVPKLVELHGHAGAKRTVRLHAVR